MVTYNYDRENAEKAFEYMKYKRANYSLGVFCGCIGAFYARHFQRTLEGYNAIFRKPWMRLPIYGISFGCTFYGGLQLPARMFPKFTYSKYEGVNHAYVSSSNDIVGKFRLFDTIEDFDARQDITNYLSAYTTQPVTKNEMLDNLALQALKEFDLGQMFRVKRAGKDRDDLFWSFGKVHGLENLAFVDPEAIKATNGNPVKIQQLVNSADRSKLPIHSFEHLVAELEAALADYRAKVDTMGMNPSDRKKVLGLPFFLAKRSELPEPREG
jgi:hypothetical protein